MNLFSEDPQFRRAQYQKLSDNVSEWQEEIAGYVDELLPSHLNLDSTVVFQKVDDSKGYGIGSVVVRNPSSDASVGIPVIIKAWHLAPLDLFFKGDKIYPLNEESLSKAFYAPGIGSGLAPRKPPPQLADEGSIDSRYPPLGGKYSYASAAQFVGDLKGTATTEDAVAFSQAVQANPAVLAKIARSGNLPRFMKFAKDISSVAAMPSEADDKASKLRASRTLTIKKNGPDEYRVYASPDGAFDPIIIDGDRRSLSQLMEVQKAHFTESPTMVLDHVDRVGEKTLKAPESPWGKDTVLGEKAKGGGRLGEHTGAPFMFDPKGDCRGVTNADKFGYYGVRDRDGVLARGFVIPNVVGFSGKKIGEKLFLSGSLSAYQNRISGIPLEHDSNIKIPGDVPETGKTGTLVYQDGDNAVATVPFQVLSTTVYQGARSLGVVTTSGERANLILSPGVDGIVPVKKSAALAPLMGKGANYLVSMKMTFVPMNKMSPVSESSDAFLKKAHAEYLDPNKLTISTGNGRYVFRSNALSKYAGCGFDFNYLPRHEAEFLLCSWGLGQEKAAQALRASHDRLAVEVHRLPWPSYGPSIEKKAAPAIAAFVRSIRPKMDDVVKVAALLEDADSVDTVLSLGFVNPDNLARFVGAKGILNETVSTLTRLLLAARLGTEEINEDAVKVAITQLQRVIAGLSKVKMRSDREDKMDAAA